MLKRRFEQKKVYNSLLVRWKFYKELVYAALLEGNAVLFVTYDGNKPIIVNISFRFQDLLFSYIQAHDIDYQQYNPGDISKKMHLQWCYENGIKIMDLSIGETPNKKKWCNHSYHYYYYLFYKNHLAAMFPWIKLRLSQKLRDLGILGGLFVYNRFFYKRLQAKIENHRYP